MLYSGFLEVCKIEQFLELLIGPVFFLKAITRVVGCCQSPN